MYRPLSVRPTQVELCSKYQLRNTSALEVKEANTAAMETVEALFWDMNNLCILDTDRCGVRGSHDLWERHPIYLHQGVTLQELDPKSDDLRIIKEMEIKHISS